MDKTWDDLLFNYLVCNYWRDYDHARQTLIDNGLTEKATQTAMNKAVYFMKFEDAEEESREQVR